MPQILRPIYIEKEEGVGSILSRVKKTSEDNLALIFPAESFIFHNVLEVEFLKNELADLDKDIVVITSDPNQLELARSLGFKVKGELARSQDESEFLADFYQTKTQDVPQKLSLTEKKDTVKDFSKLRVSDIVTKPLGENKEPVKEKAPKKPVEMIIKKVAPSEEKKEKEPSLPSAKLEAISLISNDVEIKEVPQGVPKKRFSFSRKSHLPSKLTSGGPFKKIFVLFLLAAVGVFVLSATFIFPRAEITVRPVRDLAQLSIDLVFSNKTAAVDFEKNTVPAQIFKITKTASGEFAATAEKEVQKKASGIITVYNNYSSEAQTLVQTTRFETTDGKIFRTTKTITVPGAKIEAGKVVFSSIDVEVTADKPGEAYNIGPSDFSIPGLKGTPKYQGFYGKSSQPMVGGKIYKGKVVSEDDVKQAESKLKEDLFNAAREELRKQLSTDLKLLEESIAVDITESKANPLAGEPAEKFVLTLKALAQGFAYQDKDLGDLVEEKIALKISDKRLTLPTTRKASFTKQDLDFKAGEAGFGLLVEEDISWKIEEERFKEVLAGKREGEAKEAISLFSEIDSARFELWPFWIKSIPKDPRKIKITLDYQ